MVDLMRERALMMQTLNQISKLVTPPSRSSRSVFTPATGRRQVITQPTEEDEEDQVITDPEEIMRENIYG